MTERQIQVMEGALDALETALTGATDASGAVIRTNVTASNHRVDPTELVAAWLRQWKVVGVPAPWGDELRDEFKLQLEELAIKQLPEFSRKVLYALQDRLYAEPGFSDVKVHDLADALGVRYTSIFGAISHLKAAGLVNSEVWDGNGREQIFLHTTAHDEGRKYPVIGEEVSDVGA